MTPWLVHEVRNLGLELICLYARRTRAALKMQINRTDQNDAEGLARSFALAGTGPFTSSRSTALERVPYIGAAFVIEDSDPALAVRHIGPFGSEMPMQFPYTAGGQSHVDPRDGLGNREVDLRHLARHPPF
jgi:hypothetical protein